MKRIIALLLSIAMVLSFTLNGHASSDTDNNVSDNSPPVLGKTATINDALDILKHLAEVQALCDNRAFELDFDSDGKITMSDALIALKGLAGLADTVRLNVMLDADDLENPNGPDKSKEPDKPKDSDKPSEQPTEEQPTEELPTEELPTDELTTEEQPTEESTEETEPVINNPIDNPNTENYDYTGIFDALFEFRGSSETPGSFSWGDDLWLVETDNMDSPNRNVTAQPPSFSGNPGENGNNNNSVSNTNNQVEGVQESDIVKTDGKNIYVASTGTWKWDIETQRSVRVDGKVSVVKADNGKMETIATLDAPAYAAFGVNKDATSSQTEVREMLLYDGKLVIVWQKSDFFAEVNNEQEAPDPSLTNGWWGGGRCWCQWCIRSRGRFEHNVIVEVFNTSGKFRTPDSTYLQNGQFHSARMIENNIYVITNFRPNLPSELTEENIKDFVPFYEENGLRRWFHPSSIIIPKDVDTSLFTIIGGLNVNRRNMVVSTRAILGSTSTIYCSLDNIYVIRNHIGERNTQFWRNENLTTINKFSINKGSVKFEADATVAGQARNQFHFDEYNGTLRVVTEIWGNAPKQTEESADSFQVLPIPEKQGDRGWWDERKITDLNSWGLQGGTLYTFDKNMNLLSEVHRIGFGENVHSVRFMGDIGYIVTFWQTDPLFAFDLSDPTNPVLLGELKIPGFSRYLHSWDDGLLLGMGVDTNANGVRQGLKMTMFDVADNSDLIEKHVHVLNGWGWSPVENDHRAALVSPGRNIIGFPYRSGAGTVYAVFSYYKNGFNLIGELKGGSWSDGDFQRGLYMGKYIYAISNNMIVSAELDGDSLTEVMRLSL